jgi:DNA replication factor GINS
MSDEPITFEFIRKIQREEMTEPRLSQIPEDFYQKAKDYLEQKRSIAEKKKDRMESMEVKNVERLLEDIFNRRETKMISNAIMTVRTGMIPQNLIEDEKEFYESAVNMMKSQRERVLNLLFKKTKEIKEFEKIEFIDDVEEFVGIDLKKYGPFIKGDVADIPIDNAKLLIKMEKAKRSGR